MYRKISSGILSDEISRPPARMQERDPATVELAHANIAFGEINPKTSPWEFFIFFKREVLIRPIFQTKQKKIIKNKHLLLDHVMRTAEQQIKEENTSLQKMGNNFKTQEGADQTRQKKKSRDPEPLRRTLRKCRTPYAIFQIACFSFLFGRCTCRPAASLI